MKKPVGVIQELHRYPVKSMQGEQLDQAQVFDGGLIGDRLWIVRDDQKQENALVRTLPKLPKFSARFLSEPSSCRIAEVEITLPNQTQIKSSDKQASQLLSDAIGKPVSLWPLQPKSNWQHYLQGSLGGAKDLQRKFAIDKVPDLSSLSWSLLAQLSLLTTPLGRYQDCYPLHLITSSALEELQKFEPLGDFNPQRFRPNLVIKSQVANGFDDTRWIGGKLYIGSEVVLKVESQTVRCSMPAQPQQSLDKDPKVIKTLDRYTDRHFGVNLTVIKTGRIKVGDAVYWEPERSSLLKKEWQARTKLLKAKLSKGLLEAMDQVLGR